MTSTTQNAKQGCKTRFEYLSRWVHYPKPVPVIYKPFPFLCKALKSGWAWRLMLALPDLHQVLNPWRFSFVIPCCLFVLSDLFVCLFVLKDNLTLQRRKDSNLRSPRCSVLNTGVTGVGHHARLPLAWPGNTLTILASICSRRKMEVVG